MTDKQLTWKELLEDLIKTESRQIKNPEEREKEVYDQFIKYLEPEKPISTQGTPNAEQTEIPRFFYKKPLAFNDLHFSIKSEAKQRFLMNYAKDNPDKKKLRELWLDLRKNISPPDDNTERINYKDFQRVRDNFGSLFKSYFTACNFLKFDRDKHGRIEILAFFHYVVKKNTILEYKISLSYHDVYSEGFLTDKDLENYIKDEFQQFYFYDDITKDIKEYYLLVAQRKFFFFLDPKRTGKIYINDIAVSPILSEFLEMKERPVQTESQSNWFSSNNFFKIYRKYIDLDKDRNGMLSKDELIKYSPGLTMIFIDRIFEEYEKYENGIDFKQFIDFCLAMENKRTPAAIQYIWRAVDVNRNNKIDAFVFNMFYRQVVKKLTNRNKPEYKIEDIKDEIWDMVKPKNPKYITLQDILASSYSDTILAFMIDAKAFYSHDMREVQIVDEFEELDDEMV